MNVMYKTHTRVYGHKPEHTITCVYMCNNTNSNINDRHCSYSVGGQTSAIQKQREVAVSDGLHIIIIIIVQLCYRVTRASRRPPSCRAGDRRPEKSEQTAVEHTAFAQHVGEAILYNIIIIIIERWKSKACTICILLKYRFFKRT